MSNVDKGSIDIDVRGESVDQDSLDKGSFPTEAFTFDDPNTTDNPTLTLVSPWTLSGNLSSGTTSTVTSDYTILDDDGISTFYIDASSNDVTITLPTAADNPKRAFTFIRIDDSANAITIAGEGVEGIENSNEVDLPHVNDHLSIAQYADGTAIEFIDRGDCEETTEPMVSGETVPVLSDSTWARDSGQAYEQTYSYLLSKTGAGNASARFVDNQTSSDMHGFVNGTTYKYTVRMYVPTGECLGTEAGFFFQEYTAAWNTTWNYCTNDYDQWQELSGTFTVPNTSTGVSVGVIIMSTATIGEEVYVDAISIQKVGIPAWTRTSDGITPEWVGNETTNASVFSQASPTASTWYDVDFSEFVPAHTRMVMANVFLDTSATTTRLRVYVRKNGDTITGVQLEQGGQYASTTSGTNFFCFFPLDENGIAEIMATSANASQITVYQPLFIW